MFKSSVIHSGDKFVKKNISKKIKKLDKISGKVFLIFSLSIVLAVFVTYLSCYLIYNNESNAFKTIEKSNKIGNNIKALCSTISKRLDTGFVFNGNIVNFGKDESNKNRDIRVDISIENAVNFGISNASPIELASYEYNTKTNSLISDKKLCRLIGGVENDYIVDFDLEKNFKLKRCLPYFGIEDTNDLQRSKLNECFLIIDECELTMKDIKVAKEQDVDFFIEKLNKNILFQNIIKARNIQICLSGGKNVFKTDDDLDDIKVMELVIKNINTIIKEFRLLFK